MKFALLSLLLLTSGCASLGDRLGSMAQGYSQASGQQQNLGPDIQAEHQYQGQKICTVTSLGYGQYSSDCQ